MFFQRNTKVSLLLNTLQQDSLCQVQQCLYQIVWSRLCCHNNLKNLSGLEQRSTDHDPQTRSCCCQWFPPPPIFIEVQLTHVTLVSDFVNKFFGEHSHVGSFIYCHGLLLHYNRRIVQLQKRLHSLQSQKYLLPGPLPKNLPNPALRVLVGASSMENWKLYYPSWGCVKEQISAWKRPSLVLGM